MSERHLFHISNPAPQPARRAQFKYSSSQINIVQLRERVGILCEFRSTPQLSNFKLKGNRIQTGLQLHKLVRYEKIINGKVYSSKVNPKASNKPMHGVKCINNGLLRHSISIWYRCTNVKNVNDASLYIYRWVTCILDFKNMFSYQLSAHLVDFQRTNPQFSDALNGLLS